MGLDAQRNKSNLRTWDLLTSAQAINVNTSGHSYSSVVASVPMGRIVPGCVPGRVRDGRPFGR